MPLYEYICGTCGERYEELRSLGARDTSIDCKCGGIAVILISSTNFNMNVWRDKSVELNKYCLTPEGEDDSKN